MAGTASTEQAWAEAARRCRPASAVVLMAKELGFKPRGQLKTLRYHLGRRAHGDDRSPARFGGRG